MQNEKIDFEFLFERGYIPTCVVGAGSTIYNKWGFEVDVHSNVVYCRSEEFGYIETKKQLMDIEKKLGIDQTPIMTKMSVEELKALIPEGYTYILNKRKRHKKPEHQLSYATARGRYKIVKGEEVISEGYNDQTEDYYLCCALLYILKKENLLPRNSA